MKIAEFRNVEGGYDFISEIESCKNLTAFVQISEPLEVEFIPTKDPDVVGKQIAVIDRKIEELKAATQVTLNELEQSKQELLALPSSETD